VVPWVKLKEKHGASSAGKIRQMVKLLPSLKKLRISKFLMLLNLWFNQSQRMDQIQNSQVNHGQDIQFGIRPTTCGSHQDTNSWMDGLLLPTLPNQPVGKNGTKRHGADALKMTNVHQLKTLIHKMIAACYGQMITTKSAQTKA